MVSRGPPVKDNMFMQVLLNSLIIQVNLVSSCFLKKLSDHHDYFTIMQNPVSSIRTSLKQLQVCWVVENRLELARSILNRQATLQSVYECVEFSGFALRQLTMYGRVPSLMMNA